MRGLETARKLSRVAWRGSAVRGGASPGSPLNKGYSDAGTAEAARCDLRWNVACGFALDCPGSIRRRWCTWRWRLAASERPHRISDAVAGVISRTGVLKGRRRARRSASPPASAQDGSVLMS